MNTNLVAAMLTFVNLAFAAPHPATSTSLLMDPQYGHFFQNQGFQLKTAGTDWLPTPQNEDSLFDSIRFTPKGKVNSTASISVRTDTLTKQNNLETYAKKWMRDYPSYGFEVLGAKSFTLSGGPGLVVDMVQKNRDQQIRQVILQKDRKVAILTCLDSRRDFQKTLVACNQLVKNFQWDSAISKAPLSTEKPQIK
ncbi:MAG: hypothetical protein IPM97_14545 [Bdellovibrionaceae bacterium]|nr:hypothetical protein [Pseudobdellovibrionaceae bacterium]